MVQNILKSFFVLSVFFTHSTAQGEELPSAAGDAGIASVKQWAKNRTAEAQRDFTQSGLQRMPSPNYWGGDVIYQIQVDRFNNGNPFNDNVNLPQIQIDNQNASKYKLQEYRHGGDLEGIMHRLDYLQELGIDSLWITPIFKNNNASYHNYCTSDFTQVDPAFGSNEDFRKLVSEAHKRNIKVILDIVVNHVCDSKTKYTQKATDNYGTCVSDHMSKYFSGNPQQSIRGQRDIEFSDSFFPPFKNAAFLSRCGYQAGDSGSNGAGAVFGDFSDEMLDFDTLNYDFQEIFSEIHKGWIAYSDVDGFRMDAAKHVSADFVAKFATEMRDYAQSIGKNNFYVVGEVAGEIKFFDKQITPALHVGWMQNAAESNNVPPPVKDRVQELEPVYSQHSFWPLPGLNGMYDFTLSGTLVEVWKKNVSPLNFKKLFFEGLDFENQSKTPYYQELTVKDSNSNYKIDSRLNWILLEIHDWPRFAFNGETYEQMIGAVSQLLLSEGMPIIYYGFEQGFNGAHPGNERIQLDDPNTLGEMQKLLGPTNHPHDGFYHPRHRQDMFVSGPFRLGSTHAPIHALAGVGKSYNDNISYDWKTDPYLKTDHELFQRIRALTHLRKSCPALKYGQIYFRAAHENKSGGLLAFSRIDSDSGKEALVVLNTSANDIELGGLVIDSSLARGQSGRVWKNALNGFERGWVQEANGQNPNALLSFDNPQTENNEKFILKAGAASVYIPESELEPFNDNLKVHLCR